MPDAKQKPARPRFRSLYTFFRAPSNKNLYRASLILSRVIEAFAHAGAEQEITADTILVGDDGRTISLAPSGAVASMYAPPECESGPWEANQFKIAVSFGVALSGQRDLGTGHGPGDPYWATWNPPAAATEKLPAFCSIRFREALATMLRSASDRFPDSDSALRFIRQTHMDGAAPNRVIRVGLGLVLAFIACAVSLAFLPRSAVPGRTEAPETQPVSLPPAPTRMTSSPPGMALVPTGRVLLDDVRVEVDQFFLDRSQVTIGDYYGWARLKRRSLPFPDDPDFKASQSARPVWNVSWQDATDYCADQGTHLPAESQWQRAWDLTARSGAVSNTTLISVRLPRVEKTQDGADRFASDSNGMPEWTADTAGGVGGAQKMVRGGGSYLPVDLETQRLSIDPQLDPARGLLRVSFRCAAALDVEGKSKKGGS